MLKKILLSVCVLGLPFTLQAQAVPTLYTTNSTISLNSLIQAQGSDAVYYLADDGKRYVFPNEKTYKTWYPDFSEVHVITLDQLQQYPIGGNVTYRSGTRLVKITTAPKTYAVEPGGVLRWITSEAVAKTLYGDNWAQLIDDVPDPFFVNYSVSENDLDTNEHPVGTLITYPNSEDVYVVGVENNEIVKRKVATLSDNNYRSEFIRAVDNSLVYPTGTPVAGRENNLVSLRAPSVNTPDNSDGENSDDQDTAEVPELAEPNLFVDNRVSVSGNGSSEAPFKTIAEGLQALEAGTTLYIRGGSENNNVIYDEELDFVGNGSIVAPYTIAAYPEERVIINLKETLELDQDWWRIQDVIFDNQGRSTTAIQVSGDSIVIDDIEVMNGEGQGITVVSNSENVTIADSLIHDFNDCIYILPRAINVTISGSTISDCRDDGIDIHAESGTALANLAQTITIIGNTISTTNSSSKYGINVKGVIGSIISLNEIYGFTAHPGIIVTNLSNSVTISDNEIHDLERGLEVRIAINTPRAVDIFNNVFYNITGEYAMRFDGIEGGLRVIHNTLVDVAGSPFKVQGLGISSGQIRNNLISNSGSNVVYINSQKAVVSNNGWFAGSDAGGILGADNIEGDDAGFVNAAEHNYRLQQNSLAVDAGLTLGYVETDLDNNPREVGSNPDLGAFELQ